MADFERLSRSTNTESVPIRQTIGRIVRVAGSHGVLAVVAVTTVVEYLLVILSARATGRLIDAVVSGVSGQETAAVALSALGAAAAAVAVAEIAKALIILIKDASCGQYLEPALAKMKHKTVAALGAARIAWLDRQHSGDSPPGSTATSRPCPARFARDDLWGCEMLTLAVWSCICWSKTSCWQWSCWGSSRSPGHPVDLCPPDPAHSRNAQKSVGDIGRAAGDAFNAFETVKSFRLESRMAARMDDAQDRHVEAVRRYTRVEAAMQPLSLLTRALPFFVLLVAGGILVSRGRLSFGEMAAFVILAETALPKFGFLTETISGLRHMAASGSRIMELWDAPRERTGGDASSPPSTGPGDPVLRFDRVEFAYDPANPVLEGLSFELCRGETVAIAGESGCGKSTVLRLASAMYGVEAGVVELFGRPEPQWDLAAWRDRMAYATQEPFLLDGSILENVCCSLPHDPDAPQTRERVYRVLSDVGLAPFVDDLPKGMDTPVGELGSHLSGGQRQRIALARALYRGAPLLLLDEAASALDGPAESSLLQLLSTLPESPAILTGAHRLSSIRHADRILVMQSGRIAEQGTHEQLMASGGIYTDLVASQAREGES
jgi:ABC-type multidrug transport system fused ATPase/permease subunit